MSRLLLPPTFPPKTIEQLLPEGFHFLGRIQDGDTKWWAACDEVTGESVLAFTSRGLLEAVMQLRHSRIYDERGYKIGAGDGEAPAYVEYAQEAA